MTAKDIPAVMAIEKSSQSAWLKNQVEAELKTNFGWQFVARQHQTDMITGFIIGTLIADEAEIRKIAVAPSFRKNKIGASLLNYFLTFMKTKGAASCFLEFRRSNLPACNLYKSCGFSQAGTRNKYYKNPTEDAILMAKVF
jgi:ribosomal-protein-alanine N-acetyltransferase